MNHLFVYSYLQHSESTEHLTWLPQKTQGSHQDAISGIPRGGNYYSPHLPPQSEKVYETRQITVALRMFILTWDKKANTLLRLN